MVKAPRDAARPRAATRQARDRFRLATHGCGSHALRRREDAAHAPRFARHQAHESRSQPAPTAIAKIDEALPANLRYGCAVCVQYPESAATVHADQRELFVIPTDRTIQVTTTVPAEVGPGVEIPLTVQVNRQEEIDLIVSVFDESLLGVSGDLSRDLRNYYLADARGQGRAARELAATRVGQHHRRGTREEGRGATQGQGPAREGAGTGTATPGARRAVEGTASRRSPTWSRSCGSPGYEVYLAHRSTTTVRCGRYPKTARSADLLRWEKKVTREIRTSKLYISATVIGNVALLGRCVSRRNEAEMGDCPIPGSAIAAIRMATASASSVRFCGGFNCNGFNQFGFGDSVRHQLGSSSASADTSARGFGCQRHSEADRRDSAVASAAITGFGAGGTASRRGAGRILAWRAAGLFSHRSSAGRWACRSATTATSVRCGPGGAAPLPGLGLGDEVVRRDFSDSAFWTAKLRTDKTGKATVEFKVPDSLTNWQVAVTAVSHEDARRPGTAQFRSITPIMIWPMLPRTFTEGDIGPRLRHRPQPAPTQEQTIKVHLKVENGEVLSAGEKTVKVPAKGSVPVYWTFRAGTPGFTQLLMSATCAAGSDASLKRLPVTAAGVIERVTASGLVGKDDLKLTLPDDVDPTPRDWRSPSPRRWRPTWPTR